MKDIYINLKKYLSEGLYGAVIKNRYIENAAEIRLRADKPVIIKDWEREVQLDHIVSRNELREIFSRIVEYSPYAYREEIINGYVTIERGWRVGLAGTVIEEKGIVKNIKEISSLNIRMIFPLCF